MKRTLVDPSLGNNSLIQKETDEYWGAGSWWMARRNDYYIGIYCSAVTSVYNQGSSKNDFNIQLVADGPKTTLVVSIPWYYCFL